ncbi:hypothetical protein UlMin_032201 [Ulmus minor]
MAKGDSIEEMREEVSQQGLQARNKILLQKQSKALILHLAFQSIGIVYGDIGSSPLYVYSSTFTNGIKHKDDVLSVLSLILYTLSLIPLIKYAFIALQANNNGEGKDPFFHNPLQKRYAKVGLIPNDHAVNKDDLIEFPINRLRKATWLKLKLENSRIAKYFLLLATMLGTSMVIVLSGVGGIKRATNAITEGKIVWIALTILVCLFMVQRFGTGKLGYSFAPIICSWFAFIGGIGVYNIFKFDPAVIKAINPKYIVDYFRKNKKEAWISLGGIVLSTTGSETLFADVGHFTVRSIQISMCSITYPALILTYIGQASFLHENNHLVYDSFYKSIPGPLYWPIFVMAVLAAIIASQATISATFSIIQQSLLLECFPHVKIVHTSAKYQGQVYDPEANFLLMLACIAVTLWFRNTTSIGNAYGIAVVFVITLTSFFLVLVMIVIWKTNVLLIIAYVASIGALELLYLSSILSKFDQGSYLSLMIAATIMIVMFVDHQISPDKVMEIANHSNFCQIPGLALFYSETFDGVPLVFQHYISIICLLCTLVEPKALNVFSCVARKGYTDFTKEQEPFEKLLVQKLKEFIKKDVWLSQRAWYKINNGDQLEEGILMIRTKEFSANELNLVQINEEKVEKACGDGVVHLIGRTDVIACKEAGTGKKILIDNAYKFLKKIFGLSDHQVLDN